MVSSREGGAFRGTGLLCRTGIRGGIEIRAVSPPTDSQDALTWLFPVHRKVPTRRLLSKCDGRFSPTIRVNALLTSRRLHPY